MLPRIYRFASAQTVTFDDPNLVIQTGLNGVGIWNSDGRYRHDFRGGLIHVKIGAQFQGYFLLPMGGELLTESILGMSYS
ncbi:MAG: hypothetical protein WAL56_00725 [Candidatus Sulfotelmatobacter sp.]